MKLYNTTTRSTEELTPIRAGALSIYTCGPTVYLDPHIGNWRMFIFYDTLVRSVEADGYNVRHVLNLTDVGHLVSDADDGDDKLIKTARKQNKTAWDVAEYYIGIFKAGVVALNMRQPDFLPRATDYIEPQIEMIKRLEKNGHTYTIDDGVYFDITTFPSYGTMARLDLAGQESGARVAHNTQKRNPEDFALWKFSAKNSHRDMEWGSPWGKGFPGWHIECSAIAADILGETIDIHAGGIDHIPVHHTNEIAQSEAAHGTRFSNVWMHGAFMNVDGKKMSKSLGNFYTLEDVVKEGFSPLDFRMLVISSHYRTHQNFTWDILESARARRQALQALADRRFQAIENDQNYDFKPKVAEFKNSMNNDLNTTQALGVVADVEHYYDSQPVSLQDVGDFIAFIEIVDTYLGLNLLASSDITDAQKQHITDRQEARESSDYARSDELRDELAESGVELNDTQYGTTWKRAGLS